MNNGLNNFVLTSPLSLIIGLILLIGLSQLGHLIQKKAFKLCNIEYHPNYDFLNPIVGVLCFLVIIYPFVLIKVANLFFFRCVGIFLIFISIFKILNLFYHLKSIKIKNITKNKKSFILIILFILLFLFSSSPITHSDSLAYHVPGAINLLNTGSLPRSILYHEYSLVSLGETIIALGLAMGSEQFGSLVQFSALLSLLVIFKSGKYRFYFLSVILISPMTFFLISSPKPQLLNSILTLGVFSFLYFNVKKINNYNSFKIYLIILLILSINFITKFSFILSSGLLFLMLFIYSYKYNLIKNFFITSILVFSFILVPFILTKSFDYNHNPLIFLINPVPIDIFGYDKFFHLISSGKINLFELFFPSKISKITESFGPIVLLMLCLINFKIIRSNLISYTLIVSYFVIGYIFGSNITRFLYEGFLLLIFIVYQNFSKNNIIFKIYKNLLMFLSVAFITLSPFIILNFFYGSISQNHKQKILYNYANGYSSSMWANNYLSDKDVILVFQRETAFFNAKAFNNVFLWNIKNFNNIKSKIYIDEIKKNKISKIILFGKDIKNNPFQKCSIETVASKSSVGFKTGRNPFNISKDYYHGLIIKINYKELPICLKQ